MSQDARSTNRFPAALKRARTVLGKRQEDFYEFSSRTYVSVLERGLKSPTLLKVDQLAAVLGLHPLTLLTLAYTEDPQGVESVKTIQARVRSEIDVIFEREGVALQKDAESD